MLEPPSLKETIASIHFEINKSLPGVGVAYPRIIIENIRFNEVPHNK